MGFWEFLFRSIFCGPGWPKASDELFPDRSLTNKEDVNDA